MDAVKSCMSCTHHSQNLRREPCYSCSGAPAWDAWEPGPLITINHPLITINHPLIALSGLAGSGKSTVAEWLVKEHGYVRVKFADPLKDMLRTLLAAQGVDALSVHEMIEGHLKETPCKELCGMTPRFAMQTLGTEWGRHIISPSLWVRSWYARVVKDLDEGKKVVVDDLRFPNERAAVAMLEGIHVRVIRGGESTEVSHISERGDLAPFRELHNNLTKEELLRNASSILTA